MALKKEINRIALGSLDIYMMAFNGNSIADIPEDSVIETEANLIGRTKDGGEVSYSPTFYTAKSDDGIAKRTELTEETASISFGLITWNGDTVTKIVPTASSEIKNGKRRTFIGGINNADDTLYLVRAVHKDKIKGDVRYTMLGKNLQGFAAAYKPSQECVVTPKIEAEPFDDGRLLILDEDNVEAETGSDPVDV